MTFVDIKRKTIKLPNGTIINFDKDNIRYTVSNSKASYTYNQLLSNSIKEIK